PWQAANLREIKRMVANATSIPADLVRRFSLATSRSEQAWRVCRADNDWESMKPLLEDVVALSRERAAALAESRGCSLYNALLDTYEPNTTTEMVDRVFAELKEFLPGFTAEVIGKQSQEEVLALTGDFSIDKQKQLGMTVMASMGFDFDHGRLDISHHPFCGGVPDDVRITTRYNTANFVESLMAVIHETGHAMYEQGLPVGWRDQPVGDALSAGTHESQSLLMEMQACRSREFLEYLTPIAQRVFLGHETNDPAWGVENLYRVYTRVQRSFIRVDADEVTYPLHVIMRYELERQLIEGELNVADIPEAWDAKMREYLDLPTEGNFKDGCLQDVHWPAGLFGYFPTYTLGAMTAAQLFQSAVAEVSGVHQEIGRGNFAPLLGWLRENVHSKGKFLPYDSMMKEATGSSLDAKYFKRHLQARYAG
ncbi:MAG TPA: carboxypeptidase M32, partial [Pseudomonadales bacterium]|nr:carboxypeptidase M32 [Pseudomonadales bacterium]